MNLPWLNHSNSAPNALRILSTAQSRLMVTAVVACKFDQGKSALPFGNAHSVSNATKIVLSLTTAEKVYGPILS